ncbi:MAG: sulfate adenylyltransferase, partial [Gammaproteobacteria bacterium]|nr:sulfate adenylyltransferase [Gammaproteobacteria bacterium]
MIKPHGGGALRPLLVADPDERAALAERAQKFPSALLSSSGAANAVMLGAGYFTPLGGFMDKAAALGVAESMRMPDG